MEEFTEACAILGRHTKSVIPDEHVLMMARNIDLNKDGYIDFNEFLEAFRIVDSFGRDLFARRASEESSGAVSKEMDPPGEAGSNGQLGGDGVGNSDEWTAGNCEQMGNALNGMGLTPSVG